MSCHIFLLIDKQLYIDSAHKHYTIINRKNKLKASDKIQERYKRMLIHLIKENRVYTCFKPMVQLYSLLIKHEVTEGKLNYEMV
jgi:hypothetical protein